MENLQELTGQESGIVIYPDGGVIVCNWSSVMGMPRLFEPLGIMGLKDEIPDVVASETVEDVYNFVSVNGGDIISDQNNDITAMEASDEETTGTVYYLKDKTMVIAPDNWN